MFRRPDLHLVKGHLVVSVCVAQSDSQPVQTARTQRDTISEPHGSTGQPVSLGIPIWGRVVKATTGVHLDRVEQFETAVIV